MFVRIDDLEDPRLDAYVRLNDVNLRSKLEPEKGIFIAESANVICRALEGGQEPLSFLLEEKWIHTLEQAIKEIERQHPDFPVFVAPHELLEQLVGFEMTRGAMGAFRRPALPALEDLVKDACRVAILEDITNHTNVGAIFRSAAALNIDAVLVTPHCYDPLYRRSARVSMGTVFQVPWTRMPEDGLATLSDLGFTTIALALSDDSISIDDPCLTDCERLAIVLGTEGDGLKKETINACDYTVRIPMSHDVDSLNVAAASAVAFWELRSRK